MAKTNLVVGGAVQNGSADGAALRDDGQIPFGRYFCCQARVEFFIRPDDAHAVWANYPQIRALGRNTDLFFDIGAPIAQLPAAGGDNDHTFSASLDTFADNAWHCSNGGGNHRHIHRIARSSGNAFQTGQAVQGFVFRINRHDPAAISALDELFKQAPADTAFPAAGSDNGNTGRIEKVIHCSSQGWH